MRFTARPIASQTALLFAFSLFSVGTYADKDLSHEMTQRIEKSRGQLSALQSKIGKEATDLSRKLHSQEMKLDDLKKQAAASQRLTDEKLLGLQQLQDRVDKWSTQSNYQKHLLGNYAQLANFKITDPSGEGNPEVLDQAIKRVEESLSPEWQDIDAVGKDGLIGKVSTLQLGPLALALNSKTGEGGMLDRTKQGDAVILNIYGSSELKQLYALKDKGSATIKFDPTLGNAQELLDSDSNVFQFVAKGGIWVIPIVLFGVLSLFISAFKGAQLLRLPKIDTTLIEKINTILGRGDNSAPRGTEDKIRAIARNCGEAQTHILNLALNNPVSQMRDDLLVAYLMEYKHHIERFMGIVATSAAIAPLLGLLGTVSGMINTFKMMTIFGSGDASTVSGGISEALITTELGLVVAIPSLVLSALLSRKTKSYMHALETFAIKLSKLQFSK